MFEHKIPLEKITI